MTKVLFGLAGAAAAAALLGVFVLALGPLPSRRGTAELPGLTAPVEARFDRYGIPHVRAILEKDAWRALGWIHASDRLLQMELRRRAASGTLAEALGPWAVDMDRRARIAGYRAAAERDYERATESDKAVLQAYADGVNPYLEAGYPLPLELQALSIKPRPWEPVDSLAFGRLMCEGLTIAASHEQAVFDEALSRGVDAATRLADLSDDLATRVAIEVKTALAADPPPRAPSRVPRSGAPPGSNAWALAGSRTRSGKPLLAGDPHLAPERPGVWYAAHLQSADGLDVAGLTLPGVPSVIIGHNGRVAWSLTMTQADDSDLFLEKVNLDDATAEVEGLPVPLLRRTETIHVKGGEDALVEVLESRHGPLVELPAGRKGLAVARARAWAAEEATQGVGAFLAADRARTGEALLAAWRDYRGPPVNVCWADASGHIGVSVAGAIPRRGEGDGRFAAPGWLRADDWAGLIPATELPATSDPAGGFVATANDDWSAAGKRLPFPGLYDVSDRVIRARALAEGLHHASASDMRTMQNDVLSPYAVRVVGALRSLAFAEPRAARAASILSGWDGRVTSQGPARLFFEFLRELRQAIAASAPGEDRTAWASWSLLERTIAGREGGALWDDARTPRGETRRALIERCLAAALTSVEKDAGTDPTRWSWESVHRLRYPHPFASVLPKALANRLELGPVALPGEWHTLRVAGFGLGSGRFDVIHIPSARLIVDLGDPDASRIVLPLGQSGQLFDRHDADLFPVWAAGRDVPLPFTSRGVESSTISTLRFVPSD